MAISLERASLLLVDSASLPLVRLHDKYQEDLSSSSPGIYLGVDLNLQALTMSLPREKLNRLLGVITNSARSHEVKSRFRNPHESSLSFSVIPIGIEHALPLGGMDNFAHLCSCQVY